MGNYIGEKSLLILQSTVTSSDSQSSTISTGKEDLADYSNSESSGSFGFLNILMKVLVKVGSTDS